MPLENSNGWPENARVGLELDGRSANRPPLAHGPDGRALRRGEPAACHRVWARDPHWDLWMYAEGMGAWGALEAATMHGARFVGLGHDIGSIAVGKLGDLVVLNGDPLANIRNTANIRDEGRGALRCGFARRAVASTADLW